MNEPVLQIDGLQTYYGKIHALKGISLVVRRGQIVTLLGANGAGKSTTLKTISGLIRAAAGKIVFEGTDITAAPPHDIVRMGLIHAPEGRRIFKGMSVQENLDLGGFTDHRNKAELERRRQYVFELFPILYERRAQDSGLLSGGEQQMLAIGRALMTDPKLMLLDEPSMGLAPFLVQAIMKIIRKLNQQGATILLVEQNAKVALKLADYGYVLETGKIVIEGDGATLRQDESIVKAYLGGGGTDYSTAPITAGARLFAPAAANNKRAPRGTTSTYLLMCNLTKVLELRPPSPLVLQLSPAPLTPAVPWRRPVGSLAHNATAHLSLTSTFSILPVNANGRRSK